MSDVLSTSIGVKYVLAITDTTPANVPVYNPNGQFQLRLISQVFTGVNDIGDGNKGRYVPNLDDMILDYETGFYRVTNVDPGTLQCTLVPWSAPVRGGATAADFILGVGARFPQQGYFIYVNNNATPPVLNVDSGFYTRYPNTAYFRVFVGNDPLPNTEVLSAVYGSAGEYIDDKIPALQLTDTTGLPAWVPDSAFAKRQITDGEVLTLVGYDTNGNTTGIGTFIGRNTSMVRPSNTTQYLIDSIELYGPSVDRTAMEVKCPVNATLASIILQCQVNYKDGSKVVKPIDGEKIRLVSNTNYVPMSPGINQPATLLYNLDTTEAYEGSTDNPTRSINAQYNIVADPVADAYGFKLASFPYWISASLGYGMKHYLHDLDHDAVYDVSNMVELAATSDPLQPKAYGTQQHIAFSVDVSRVDPRFNPYNHVQDMWVSLYADGTVKNTTNWTVLFEQGYDTFGRNCQMISTYVSSGVYQMDITSGAVTLSEWLQRIYTNTRPIFNSNNEGGPLVPSHFIIQVAGIRKRFPISSWQDVLQFEVPGTAGDIAAIHFTQEVDGQDRYLSTAGLIIRTQ